MGQFLARHWEKARRNTGQPRNEREPMGLQTLGRLASATQKNETQRNKAMGLFTKLKKALLGKEETKAKAACAPQPVMGVDSLPPFRLATADVMRYDPQVRIGLGARNGLLMAGEIEVQGDTPEVMRWVTEQWNRIWSIAAHHFLRTKHYGFLPFEVSYREAEEGEFAGLIEVDGICDRSPHGTRLLVKGETIVGYVERDHAGNERRVMSPKGLVCTFESACGQPYGCSLLARAYPAWHEKWAEGGAKRTIRLRMIKDAYLGDTISGIPPFTTWPFYRDMHRITNRVKLHTHPPPLFGSPVDVRSCRKDQSAARLIETRVCGKSPFKTKVVA